MTTLEDASGFRGEADRYIAPASEAELLEIYRQRRRGGASITIVGARHRPHRRLRSTRWLCGLAPKIPASRNLPGPGYRWPRCIARRAATDAAHTGQFYAPDPTERTASMAERSPPTRAVPAAFAMAARAGMFLGCESRSWMAVLSRFIVATKSISPSPAPAA